MFLFNNGFYLKTQKIRGVNYAVCSFYDGKNDVFEHIGKLIENAFEASTVDEITTESLVDCGIDKAYAS